MSFKAKFVAIGGKSGVGKTTLVNSLITSYPNIFKRPASYTTRPRRKNEDKSEYNFISEDDMKMFYEQGKLINLDLNYGNYYAMDKADLFRDLESLDLIIIKEIHPQYHDNIKKLVGDNCISVLIKELEPEMGTRGRSIEDDSYYSNHGENEFDLVYVYDKSSSQENNAKNFYRRLMAYIGMSKMFPPAKVIDAKNLSGYSKVAAEFIEERRITTRNFHEISKAFWSSFIGELQIGVEVLELGPGNGWLRSSFEWPCVNYSCVDIASGMRAVSNAMNGIVSSARCIPVKNNSFDYVVAALADPYFYPEVLCEVNRVLKEDALFVATLPDKEWADNLRGENNHKTSFLLDNGGTATVFSFTFNDGELKSLAEECGFSICQLLHLQGIALREHEISPAIVQSAEKANKTIDSLDVVTAIIWRKRKDG